MVDLGLESGTKANKQGILQYWFGRLQSDGDFPLERSRNLWGKDDPVIVEDMKNKFESLVKMAGQGSFDQWKDSAHGALALILMLDQFPRIMYRNAAEAYQFDEHAQKICQWAITRGVDQSLYPVEKVFFYRPLMHAENPDLQQKSVEYYEQLEYGAPASIRVKISSFRNEAIVAQKWIEAFGRFPQRNEVLGRESTPEELEVMGQAEAEAKARAQEDLQAAASGE